MVQVPSLVPSDEKYRWFLFGFAHFSLILINISYFKLLALNYLPRYLVAVHIHNFHGEEFVLLIRLNFENSFPNYILNFSTQGFLEIEEIQTSFSSKLTHIDSFYNTDIIDIGYGQAIHYVLLSVGRYPSRLV